jgi:GNAT superfamily N-acetyltransferase
VLWRVRTTLSDRPGSLATLARHCGEQRVNILALQIFPGLSGVTDELVLRAPSGWGVPDVARLVEGAGGSQVTVGECSEHALVDAPIQYLHALSQLRHDPTKLRELLARLLDAHAGPGDDLRAVQDELRVDVGAEVVELRRTASFTATEHARAVAFAEVAAELVGRGQDDAGHVDSPSPGASSPPVVRVATLEDTDALMRMHVRCSADTIYRRYATPLARIDDRFARRLLLAGGGALVAAVGTEVVGVASMSTCEDDVAEVTVLVEDGWQRRGIGGRLLASAARLARAHGAREVVLRSHTHNPALMALAFASGLRARIRLEGDTVVVTVGVDSLKPLALAPAPQPSGDAALR